VNDRTLSTQLLCAQPGKVVLVGEPIFRLKATLTDLLADESCSTPAPPITQYDSINQFMDTDGCVSHKCAMGIHVPCDADEPEHLLGMACRTSPGLVLVEHTSTTSGSKLLGDEQFFAYGFRRMGQNKEVSGLQQQWYVYSLRDYKQSPDWLNARFWAHPERFDLQD